MTPVTTPKRTTLAGATALTTAVLPIFLVGALVPFVRRDLGLEETAVGAVVTVVFAMSSLLATPAGRIVERVGAGVALRTGVVLAGACAVATAAVARDWWTLTLPLLPVGFAVALVDTGAARAFADRVPGRRQGLAFGIKEASIPGASMLAGVSLPTLAAVLGWRASFVAAGVVALIVLLALPTPRGLRTTAAPEEPSGPVGSVATPALVRFAVAAGLGTGAATAAATFMVPSVVATGVSESGAGIVLSVASLASIVMRMVVGGWADRTGGSPVGLTTRMMVVGGAAAAALAIGLPTPLLVLAAMVALGAGWGWTGLAFLAGVRSNPAAPAAAAGVVLTGLGAGSALGPLAFGLLVGAGGYRLAWLGMALSALLGAVLARSARAGLDPVGA
jgi:MFS family permease